MACDVLNFCQSPSAKFLACLVCGYVVGQDSKPANCLSHAMVGVMLSKGTY